MFIKTDTDYINTEYIRRIYVTDDLRIRAETDDGRKITLRECDTMREVGMTLDSLEDCLNGIGDYPKQKLIDMSKLLSDRLYPTYDDDDSCKEEEDL